MSGPGIAWRMFMVTESIDVAQIVLYVFWLFFFGLIFWLRREDRREGYPLEYDNPSKLFAVNPVLIPPPKTFLLPHGGSVQAPNFERDARPINAQRTSPAAGSPYQPNGDPLLSGVGPASYAQRHDTVDQTREGHDLIVPMRVAQDYSVNAGPDPRGWSVVAADKEVAGVVKDLWVDRADVMVRYVEVELKGTAERRLLPITMLRLLREPRKVEVASLRAAQFASVPTTKEVDRITSLEEERIQAFYAGGRLYADAQAPGAGAMSSEVEFEPIPGLPHALPPGERLLWQGRPSWRGLARHTFQVRWLSAYFGVFTIARAVIAVQEGHGLSGALLSMIVVLPLAALCIGLLTLLAWLNARATVYTITSRRVVMRFGVAFPMTFNLPFKRLAAAALTVRKEGEGDISLQLAAPDRIAWLHLWPHARPWRLARPSRPCARSPTRRRCPRCSRRRCGRGLRQKALRSWSVRPPSPSPCESPSNKKLRSGWIRRW